MNLQQHLAKHLRDVHFGGNWTWVNLKEVLSDVTPQEATTKVVGFNSIVALAYHINYFVLAILNVMENRPLTSHDKYSFDHPSVNGEEDWKAMQEKILADAEKLAGYIEQLPEGQVWEIFEQEKYGNYYRNIQGLIEHTHYHMGQIVIIKKMLRAGLAG